MTRNSPITEISQETYWYAASKLNTIEGRNVPRMLDFALTLHNARIGKGFICSLSTLLDGIEIKLKNDTPREEAEKILEEVRRERYEHLPSRLRCYFLSKTKDAAHRRASEKFRNVPHIVTPCHLVGNDYSTHCTDTRIFESLENRLSTQKAHDYWSGKLQLDDDYTEVLFDGELYFPEWQEFPLLDEKTLVTWQHNQKSK